MEEKKTGNARVRTKTIPEWHGWSVDEDSDNGSVSLHIDHMPDCAHPKLYVLRGRRYYALAEFPGLIPAYEAMDLIDKLVSKSRGEK